MDDSQKKKVDLIIRVTTIVLIMNAVILLFGGLAWVHFANQNSKRVDDIQRSREESIILTCNEQNARHDTTLGAINTQVKIGLARANAEEKMRILESIAGTRIIIDALVPKRNCIRRARSLTRTKPTLK